MNARALDRGQNFGSITTAIVSGDLCINAADHAPGMIVPRHEHANAYLCVVMAGCLEVRARRAVQCPAGSVIAYPAGSAFQPLQRSAGPMHQHPPPVHLDRHDGRAVPNTFDDDMPLLSGRIDGVGGLFALDIGNSGTTVVQHRWAAKHGMAKRLKGGVETMSYGAGGASRNWASRADALETGGVLLERPNDRMRFGWRSSCAARRRTARASSPTTGSSRSMEPRPRR